MSPGAPSARAPAASSLSASGPARRAATYGGVLEASGGAPRDARAAVRGLLVSGDARREATAAVVPSPLLARMETFLPRLAEANARLPEERGGGEMVEIVQAGEGVFGEGGEDAAGGQRGDGEREGAEGKRGVEEEEEEVEEDEDEVLSGGAGISFRVEAEEEDECGDGSEESSESEESEGSEVGEEGGKKLGERRGSGSGMERGKRRKTAGQGSGNRAVQMDIYIDGSLGELVQNEGDAAPQKKLIEDLSSASGGVGTVD